MNENSKYLDLPETEYDQVWLGNFWNIGLRSRGIALLIESLILLNAERYEPYESLVHVFFNPQSYWGVWVNTP